MTSTHLTLATIRRAFAAHQPAVLSADRPHAAVAMLLMAAQPAAEELFIVRAEHDHDPWSGNIGFPGGRMASDDADPRRTAERETREELAIDLTCADYLGRLDDLYGATLPILVSGFVYAVASRPCLCANHEIADSFWLPLDRLLDPTRHRVEHFSYRGRMTSQPVVDLLGPGAPLLWGITYRLLGNFFAILKLPFGPPPA